MARHDRQPARDAPERLRRCSGCLNESAESAETVVAAAGTRWFHSSSLAEWRSAL